MLALKSGPQITAKTRIWYSVGKSGVLGITEYRQGRPLFKMKTALLEYRLIEYN